MDVEPSGRDCKECQRLRQVLAILDSCPSAEARSIRNYARGITGCGCQAVSTQGDEGHDQGPPLLDIGTEDPPNYQF